MTATKKMNNYDIAAKVVSEIRKRLLTMKKEAGAKNTAHEVDVYVDDVDYLYGIKVGDPCDSWNAKLIAKVGSRGALDDIGVCIEAKLLELKQSRGWGNLFWEWDRFAESRNHWGDSEYATLPSRITFLGEPCKEFKSLLNYLEKFGGRLFLPKDFYSVEVGGKRGHVYGEEGERTYLCHRPKRCAELLEELRKKRGSKDTMECSSIQKKTHVDKWEYQRSIREETEFSGVFHSFTDVTIKTPSGKVKATIKIR